MLLLAALLLFTSVVVGTLVDTRRDREQATAPAPPAATGTARGTLRTVEGRMPAQKVVRARVGDLVSLTIAAPSAGDAAIDSLGVSAPADPIVPGTLEFVAEDVGRFPVTAGEPPSQVGMVVVEPAA